MNTSASFGADDFKEHIHSLLTKRGVQHGLKASLRAQILKVAKSDGFLQNASFNSQPLTIDEKVAVGITAQFMKRKNMDLSLSVFLPAVGYNSMEDCLSSTDISELCNIENSGDLFGDLLRKIKYKKEILSMEISTQTQGSSCLELDERLAMIDQAYAMPSRSGNFSSSNFDQIQQTIKDQIEKSVQMKSNQVLESQTSLIRAEEKVKFDQELIKLREESEKKIRRIREDLFEREKRINSESNQRNEEIERNSYNQRQQILNELQRIQEKETELSRKEQRLIRQSAELESKEKTIEQLVKIQVESLINKYDSENAAEKERTIIARNKAETILKHVSEQQKELDGDKNTISRLRGSEARLTAELSAERAAHSTVQIEIGQLSQARAQISEMTQEVAQLKGQTINSGTYQAQAREVPALRQTIHTLSAKCLEREKELGRVKFELNTLKGGQPQNLENAVRNKSTRKDEDDSLISKARSRWATLENEPEDQNEEHEFNPKISKVKFHAETEMKKTSHKKPVSSTPLPVEHFEVTEDFGDNSTVVPQTDNAYEIYKSKMEKLEESDFIEESISEESQQNILSHRSDHNSATFGSQRSRGSLKPSSSRHSSPIQSFNFNKSDDKMAELSLGALGSAKKYNETISDQESSHHSESVNNPNDTLERLLGEKTVGESFATLHQTQKTPERTANENSPLDGDNEQSQKSTRNSEDQSFHSSKYSVDQSISLSAISGEFENKSVHLSTEYDSSDFDPGIRQFANDPRWKKSDSDRTVSEDLSQKSEKVAALDPTSDEDNSW